MELSAARCVTCMNTSGLKIVRVRVEMESSHARLKLYGHMGQMEVGPTGMQRVPEVDATSCVDVQAKSKAMTAVEQDSSSASDDEEEKAGYFGLDDSDMDEWLESSSAESVKALAVARGPAVSKVLTATVWRGPREGPSGDACRLVPPNRFYSALN